MMLYIKDTKITTPRVSHIIVVIDPKKGNINIPRDAFSLIARNSLIYNRNFKNELNSESILANVKTELSFTCNNYQICQPHKCLLYPADTLHRQ